MKKVAFFLSLIINLSFASGLNAQDYMKQFEALTQAVNAKNGEALQPFIGSEMAILPMITKEQLTPAILGQVLQGVLKEVKSVSLREFKVGEMVIFYDFEKEKFEDRVSSILFDSEGKIKEIKVIIELMQEEQARTQGKDAEQPIADELTEKYQAIEIEFNTSDDRTVVGALYETDKNRPVILLCHQAGSNKYEYADIAPKLNELGFNALAVDLTGGGVFAAHNNETVEKGTPLGNEVENRQLIFGRAKEEINAAVNYLYERYDQKVIVWGSSFSANYAIVITAKNENAKAAISFSGLAGGLSKILPTVGKPLFMTSSREESPRIKELLKGQESKDNIVHFIPESEGGHGSSVLWNGQPDAEEYWVEVKAFLQSID